MLYLQDSIRQGYWILHEAAAEGRQIIDGEVPISSTRHFGHCVELLRQSLMCLADTTIETKNKVTKGVQGFGVQHQCRDWNQLLEWTNEHGGRENS